MNPAWLITVTCLLAMSGEEADPPQRQPLDGFHRIVFLGDSITYAGEYITFVESYLRLKQPALRCEFLNLGLPSETVSGLSEPGHAAGQFPRPELRERLDRVLEKTRPDLVVACYGMNDGIYAPFDESRFVKFQEGMRSLRVHAERSGAKVLHLTPPIFDPQPLKGHTLPAGLAEYPSPFEGYDGVLERYSHWLMKQREAGWKVVDVHGPMARNLAEQRQRDPKFRLSDDGVHAGSAGHWLIARELLRYWDVPEKELSGEDAEQVLAALPRGAEVLKLVSRRQATMKDSWLSATGHKRPGMNRGVPLDEARRLAQEIESRIQRLVGAAP